MWIQILVNVCPLANVIASECEGRSNNDLLCSGIASHNFVLGGVVSSELGADIADLAVQQSLDHVSCAVAHVDGVPQIHVGACLAFANVILHFGGQTQTITQQADDEVGVFLWITEIASDVRSEAIYIWNNYSWPACLLRI